MQIAKMTVGTTYYVTSDRDWENTTYGVEVYVLMDKTPYSSPSYFGPTRKPSTVTIDGTDYSYWGSPWQSPPGGRKYLMRRVDPTTGEFLGSTREGRQMLNLVPASAVRGEYAETAALVQKNRAERAEERRKREEQQARRSNLGESLAARLRGMLGLDIDRRYGTGVEWHRDSVSLNTAQAQALVAKVEGLEAEVARLQAEAAENNRLKDALARRSMGLDA